MPTNGDPFNQSGTSPPANPFPPLDDDTLAALRESIRRFGILQPIVVDPEGNVLDGHHRSMLASELGVPVPSITAPEDADPEEIARTLNLDRRHLSVEERRAFAVKLSAEGKPLRAIAKATGVSHETVRKDLKAGDSNESPSSVNQLTSDTVQDIEAGEIYIPLTAEDVIRTDPGVRYYENGWISDSDGNMYRKSLPKRRKPVSEAKKAQQRRKQCHKACMKYIASDGRDNFEALVAELALFGRLAKSLHREAGE